MWGTLAHMLRGHLRTCGLSFILIQDTVDELWPFFESWHFALKNELQQNGYKYQTSFDNFLLQEARDYTNLVMVGLNN